MKLNKTETKLLRAIRDKKPVKLGKSGRVPLATQKSIVSLISKKLIHLCDENHLCISDLEMVDSLIGASPAESLS